MNERKQRIKNTELTIIANQMLREVVWACIHHKTFNSLHEGKAVIEEEFDELWAEIKKYPKESKAKLRKEAIQLGAMAMRFIYDLLADHHEREIN